MLKRTGILVAMAVMTAASLSACTSSGTSGTPQAAVNKGTVPLSALKLGTPENVFKEAIITFIPDQYGTTKDKNQYLSRFTDESGGQYVVQAKDDLAYEISIIHREKPLTKDEAMGRIKRLLPMNITEAPELVKPVKKKDTTELYKIGNGYTAVISYKDPAATEVQMVTVTRVPGANVAAAPTSKTE